MNDDRMDEILREGVRDYNEPGAVPREEMWARIQAGRDQRDTVGTPVPIRSSRRLWVWPSMGAAAAVLVAAGIVIGQRLERSSSAVAPTVTQTAANVAQRPDSASRAVQPVDSTRIIESKLREATQETNRRARELASAARPSSGASDRSGNSSGVTEASVPNLAYRLVVLQHLAGTEAMITSFRATAERGETDTLMVAWSRELLGTTRMLAASTAANDPVMKRLLQDLDFVITEIVQYSAHGVNNPEELKLIEQSINERSVIPKLRGTIPRRVPSAGT